MPYTVSGKPNAEKYLAGIRDARRYVRLREAIYGFAEGQHPPGSVTLQGEGSFTACASAIIASCIRFKTPCSWCGLLPES